MQGECGGYGWTSGPGHRARIWLGQGVSDLYRYYKRAGFVLFPNRYGPTGILRARFNDAVFVSNTRKYLFVSNEKVANSTLRATFQTLDAGGILPVHYKPFKRWTGPLLQPSDISWFDELIWDPGVFKFCVVRDPYARLVSCYRDKLEQPSSRRTFKRMMGDLGLPPHARITFCDFVHAIAKLHHSQMNAHFRPQVFNTFMDLIPYDEIVRFDEFRTRLPELIARLYPETAGNPAASIISRKRNERTAEVEVDRYYTPELRRLVERIYRLDFEMLGFPRYGEAPAAVSECCTAATARVAVS